ncbi:cytochrome C [Geothermobacter hydrogeniphilus]|uniref:Cytochrome C n=1 Tax=Geothermobacter hydrogeniphilus TaxID=1969733 RepID=A0A1X0YCZ9_9BACT|nr:cytochrome C [Geothermobacter hydrogeniphilus]ORJ62979.1 cytochrome C [Geothermobacter hydrogeniphilus]
MKKRILILLTLLLFAAGAEAKLVVIGSGNDTRFDPSGFPPEMQKAYKLMEVKCVKCHSLERAAIALQTGIAPITGGLFDRNATRAYGIKMLRKPDSNMTKQDVKIVVPLLNYMLGEVEH